MSEQPTVDIARLPEVVCSHCMGERLGFDVGTNHKDTSVPYLVVYQGCNDCSETLWTGSFAEFLDFLEFVYEMKVPTLD